MSQRKTPRERARELAAERTARHRDKHPEGESVRKEKQRQIERVRRLHITREHLYKIPVPAWIDQTEDVFIRVKEQYMAAVEQTLKENEDEQSI